MCRWDAVFYDMPDHKRVKTDEYTGKEATHTVRACPEEYDHSREVVWMDFINVVRTEEEKENEEDEEYGSGDGVKTKIELLSVYGTVPEILVPPCQYPRGIPGAHVRGENETSREENLGAIITHQYWRKYHLY